MEYSVLLTVGGIILVDLLLSGDNAILIALASRNLPRAQQKKAILWGTAGAIGLRVIFAFVASLLVQVPLLKAAGGIMLLWIAVKLLIEEESNTAEHQAADCLRAAVKTIIVADGIMSLDNVLAVVALADGRIGMVIMGIAISIPFVMISSQWLLKMINRFPVIVYIGAAVLGYAAAGMLTSDLWLRDFFTGCAGAINIVLAVAVVVIGALVKIKKRKRMIKKNSCAE